RTQHLGDEIHILALSNNSGSCLDGPTISSRKRCAQGFPHFKYKIVLSRSHLLKWIFTWLCLLTLDGLWAFPLAAYGAVPPAPTTVSPGSGSAPGSTVSGSSTTLHWNAVSGATGYGVYVSVAP